MHVRENIIFCTNYIREKMQRKDDWKICVMKETGTVDTNTINIKSPE